MEELGFDIDGLLSDEEAQKLFLEDPDTAPGQDTGEEDESPEIENEPDAEDPEDTKGPERVGEGKDEIDEEEEGAAPENDGGSSPTVFYSSIAKALKDDGIFPDLDDETIKNVKGPDDFGEFFEQAVQSRMDEVTKRIYGALNSGVEPTKIQQYEQTLNYLDGISESAISAEGDEGDELRRYLIYNDLLTRGYSQERANREVKKSFDLNTEIADAKDALASLQEYYEKQYEQIRKDAETAHNAAVAKQKKDAEDFKKMVIDTEFALGDQKLDKKTRQKVYDSVVKPVYKDPDTGKLLTQVQKFQKEQPLEFLKQLGLWFVLTDGGKDMVGFTKGKVRSEKHKAMRELAQKLSATSLNSDGSLRFASGESDGGSNDLLLSDDWKIG